MVVEPGSAFPADERTPVPGASVTIVAGSSFMICSPEGDIVPGGMQGYFAGDTRLLSELRLRVAGRTPRLVSDDGDEREVRSVSTVGDPTGPSLLVSRHTRISDSLTIEVRIENLTGEVVPGHVELTVAADFADLFDVKRGVAPRAGFIGSGPVGEALLLAYESDGFRRALRVACDRDGEILRDGVTADLLVEPWERTVVVFELQPESAPGTPLGASGFGPVDADAWRSAVPVLRSSSAAVRHTWQRSCTDLGSLLLGDARAGDHPIVAAGSPWFMALFGRDSLITSSSSLVTGSSLGLGTLAALAARQGTRYAAGSAEQPGRILHELRAGEVVLRPGGWGAVYFGSADATPLFVTTLTDVWRWGADAEEVAALLPAAERAVDWITGDGDADGDGFVEYGGGQASGTAGLANQGWKDSDDAVRHRDGRLARGPIAMVEVQGYCHAALLGLAALREAFGTGDPAPLRARADALAAAIDEQFWMADEDCYALALDGDKRQVGSVTSNAGHLLWTGTVPTGRVESLARRLLRDDLFTGYGLRTLGSTNPGFNPLSYHCGSVWPHDTAIVAAGMIRSGCTGPGATLAAGLFRAAQHFDGRLPELFGGFASDRFPGPIPYPTSCAPQAWAAGSALLVVQALLGLQPDVPAGTIRLAPCLPDEMTLELRGVPLGRARLDVRARGHVVEDATVTDGLEVLIACASD